MLAATSPRGVVDSLDELIGNTPLLRLRLFDGEISCTLYLKLESWNPGGSVKDRTALALIRYGEQHGLLKPGGVIVEPTSGNTGVGLALVAAQRGYKCIFTVRDKVSKEKIALLRAYGAEVIVCPSNVSPEHPSSYYSMATHIAKSIAGAYRPDQYGNLANRLVHYETTGPEIWKQTNGRVSHFVAGAGTGGTISGVGSYLKARDSGIRIVCVDPSGSIFSTSKPRPYLVEGVGSDFLPSNFVEEVIDTIEVVADHEAVAMCHLLVGELGLLAGGSGGMVLAGALRVARKAEDDAVVVALMPDSGRGYVSKIYSDLWLTEHGLPSARQAVSAIEMIETTCRPIQVRKAGSMPIRDTGSPEHVST